MSFNNREQSIVELGKKWRRDPVSFVREAIGVEPVPWQREALEAIRDHNKVSVRSGHGVGKSSCLAWIVLWWLCTKAPAKVACTAPTSHQLQDVLWSEIGHWHAKLRQELKDMIEVKKEYVIVNGRDKDCFAVARTARQEQPEAFQGFHSPNMLFIVDEASAVPDIIFQVGQGAMSTKGAKTIMVGNPNRLTGFFYDSFYGNRQFWKNIRVSCEDSPLASKEYIEEMRTQYGVDHDVYRIRVLGDFPKGEANAVMDLGLIDEAVERFKNNTIPFNEMTREAPMWGLDVARFGADRSALAKRHGFIMKEPVQWKSGHDLMEITGWIVDEYRRTPEHDRPFAILVDSVGYGAGVLDRLRELGLPAKGVNASSSAKDKKKFYRLRDELWFKASDWFRDNHTMLCDDGPLIKELASIEYKYRSDGKLKVEDKDEMKEKGQRSPDLADAFVLTFGYRVPVKTLTKRSFADYDYDIFS